MKTRIWIANVNRSDGRKLVSWWNANTDGYYFLRQVGWRHRALYDIVRER